MHHPGQPALGPLSGAVETQLGPHQVNILLRYYYYFGVVPIRVHEVLVTPRMWPVQVKHW
jgi:hypothetical protein